MIAKWNLHGTLLVDSPNRRTKEILSTSKKGNNKEESTWYGEYIINK